MSVPIWTLYLVPWQYISKTINLATSDSTNDFSDPIKLGQYDVDFPEQTVDKFDVQRGQSTQQIIPSPNDPNAPFQKPVKAKVPAVACFGPYGPN